MTAHPSTACSFDDLRSALEVEIARKMVKCVTAPDAPHLALYTYSRKAVVDHAWNPTIEMARGLVLDHAQRCVVARPFPKFFNYGEQTLHLPDAPFVAYEKLDGSLGIVFHDGSRWRAVTKGSFIAEQALWAERWLAERAFKGLKIGYTYLFEVIYATNRVVILYPFEGLVILGAYDDKGVEIPLEHLQGLAADLKTRTAHHQTFASIEAVREAAAAFDATKEGFVVRFASGLRIKIKGSQYLRLHRLISRVTPLALWEILSTQEQTGAALTLMRQEIPEEFWGDFDQIRSLLEAGKARHLADIAQHHQVLQHLPDQELGRMLKSLPSIVQGAIFWVRKEAGDWQQNERVLNTVWRDLRPTNNVLPGYVPSEALGRVQDDQA